MTEDLKLIYDEYKTSNSKAIEHLESELVKIRAGKASPNMISGVLVEYYGSQTPLSQVANVSTLDHKTISIQPWEKSLIGEIMKGIINSNLGFAPQNNGDTVLISVPPLTEERRKELAKKSRAEGENAKVAIRNNRKDALDMIKALKDENYPEDMLKDAENEVQNITNSFIKRIDEITAEKEKEIMTV